MQLIERLAKSNYTNPGLALLIVLAFVPLFVSDQYILQLLISALMFGTLAMAFDFTVGFINVVNFGFAAFWGIAGYTSALLATKLGVSPWMGIFAGFLVAALLGFFVGLLTLRLHGIFAAVMAWFTGLALMSVITNWTSLTRGPLGLMSPMFFDTMDRQPYFYVILVMAAFSLVVLLAIANSKIGLFFRAIGQDEDAAKASGVNPVHYRVLNFTVSTAIAGLIGGFYAHFMGILTPSVMKTSQTIEIMALAYVGGRGSVWGSLIAAMIFIPVLTYLQPLMELRLIIYGVVLIAVMIFYPGGISALYRSFFVVKKSD